MKFELSPEEVSRVDAWLKDTVFPAVIAKQKEANPDAAKTNPFMAECWEEGFPYTGATGGGLTYEFTPTSLGMVTVVRHAMFKEELNLTDYSSW